jgi:glycosyltransferase involved in cell wall biosynthesis
MNSPKVLFVSHDANRAGSQLLLLQLIKLLAREGVATHLLLCDNGELTDEFKSITSTTLIHGGKRTLLERVKRRFLSKLPVVGRYFQSSAHAGIQAATRELMQENIGLVFVNSVANAGFYEQHLSFLHHLPLVVFAHELEMSVTTYTRHDHLRFLLKKCDHLIAVSLAVAEFYVEKFGFPERQVSTFTLINTQEIGQKLAATDHSYLEQHLNLPSDAIVIGGCGNAEWRKGNDIFNLIAREVISQLPEYPIYFVWVGAGPQHPFYEQIRFDIERFGLEDRIILIPPTPKALDIMTRFDIFLLSSREDPYPLVVLEAALLKKPVVCFQKAGGAPELIEEDAGEVVEYLNVQAASNALVSLVQHPATRQSKGLRAYQKVLERHNTDQSIQKVISIIEKHMKGTASEIVSQA